MISRAGHAGNHVVEHVVKPGESLSLIAIQYKRPHWKPIFEYNSRSEFGIRSIGDNPDRIEVGARILIPRSREGYEYVIKALNQLKQDVWFASIRMTSELEADNNRHQAERVLFSFASDCAKLVGALGVRVARAASAAKTAAQARTAGEKAAAEYLVRNRSKEVVEAIEDSMKDTSAKIADQDIQPGVDLAWQGYKTAKKVKKVFTGIPSGVKFLDVADIALDYIDANRLADAYIKFMSGEKPEDTFDGAIKNIRRYEIEGLKLLQVKIDHYTREMNLLYTS